VARSLKVANQPLYNQTMPTKPPLSVRYSPSNGVVSLKPGTWMPPRAPASTESNSSAKASGRGLSGGGGDTHSLSRWRRWSSACNMQPCISSVLHDLTARRLQSITSATVCQKLIKVHTVAHVLLAGIQRRAEGAGVLSPLVTTVSDRYASHQLRYAGGSSLSGGGGATHNRNKCLL